MTKQGIAVAAYLTQQLSLCGKSQIEVSTEVGYDNPNVLTMLKQGKTKLPINKVKVMARALGVDPIHLLRLTMLEYMPDTWEVISDVLGGTVLTTSEKNIIKLVRQSDGGLPVEPATETEKAELRALTQKWADRIMKNATS